MCYRMHLAAINQRDTFSSNKNVKWPFEFLHQYVVFSIFFYIILEITFEPIVFDPKLKYYPNLKKIANLKVYGKLTKKCVNKQRLRLNLKK